MLVVYVIFADYCFDVDVCMMNGMRMIIPNTIAEEHCTAASLTSVLGLVVQVSH